MCVCLSGSEGGCLGKIYCVCVLLIMPCMFKAKACVVMSEAMALHRQMQ